MRQWLPLIQLTTPCPVGAKKKEVRKHFLDDLENGNKIAALYNPGHFLAVYYLFTREGEEKVRKCCGFVSLRSSPVV